MAADSAVLARRAARGAALLDRERPGWEHEINVGTLDLDNGCRCVLGQLYRNYSAGVRVFVGPNWTTPTACGWSTRHGFQAPAPLFGRADLSAMEEYLDALTEAWVEVIKDRVNR